MQILTAFAEPTGRRTARCHLLILSLGCATACLHAQPATSAHASVNPLFHAYALAELGRHTEAAQALGQLHAQGVQGQDADEGALGLERSASDHALQFTQDCAKEKSCVAEDFLAIGKFPEALTWQKQWIRSIRDEQKTNLRKGEERSGGNLTVKLADETDSTGGRLVTLADAYDLQARIEAAMGQLTPALKDLDAAIKALPAGPRTAPRQAGYTYHRALILAENGQFAGAAKACRDSLSIDRTALTLGERRQSECNTIEVLASASLHQPPVTKNTPSR